MAPPEKVPGEDLKVLIQPAVLDAYARALPDLPLLLSAKQKIVHLIGESVAGAALGKELLKGPLAMLLQPGD